MEGYLALAFYKPRVAARELLSVSRRAKGNKKIMQSQSPCLYSFCHPIRHRAEKTLTWFKNVLLIFNK